MEAWVKSILVNYSICKMGQSETAYLQEVERVNKSVNVNKSVCSTEAIGADVNKIDQGVSR